MRFQYREREPLSKSVFWLSVLVFSVAAVFFVLVLYFWMVGPNALQQSKGWEVNELEVMEWMRLGTEAEQAFKLAWERDPAHPDVFNKLEEAIGYQRKLKVIDPKDEFGAVSRLNRLLSRLENTKGKHLYSLVKINLDQATEFASRGDTVRAVPLLERALEAQEWINSQFLDSRLEDRGEVTRINQWLDSLKTVDAAAEVDRYAEEGRRAFSENEWDRAEERFKRAVVLQESINLNMPESSHVRWRLVQELKDNLRRIEAARMNDRIEELISSSGQVQMIESIERGLDLQLHLNERFSNTEFFNPERAADLRRQLASDLSEANAVLLQEQVERLDSYLRQKDWASVKAALLELEESLSLFESRFSLSLLKDPTLVGRVAWLIQLDQQVEVITESVGSRLVNHPSEDLKFYNTEVDQYLFELVLGLNPSRWIGADLPVDSVSFDQANEFCTKLGWVLGQTVVLPQIAWLDFLEMLSVKEDQIWLTATSQFKSQPVGSSTAVQGLYDIYGNLAEWVTVGDTQEIGLFGGSGADSFKRIKDTPLIPAAANFRSRWTGFRFCVLEIE